MHRCTPRHSLARYSVYLLYWNKSANIDAASCGKVCMRESRVYRGYPYLYIYICVRESIDEIAQAFVRYSVYLLY